jgi:hypothetical protein
MGDLDQVERALLQEEAKVVAQLEAVRRDLEHIRKTREIIRSVGKLDAAGKPEGERPALKLESTPPERLVYHPDRAITGLTGAIIGTLEKNRGKWMTPADVRKQMKADGFKASTINFPNIVTNMLRKLAVRGAINMQQKAYGSLYSAK